MPTHHLTTRFTLGDVVTWAGEPGTRFSVTQILIGLRSGLGEVITYGLHDPALPRPWLIWGYEADCLPYAEETRAVPDMTHGG